MIILWMELQDTNFDKINKIYEKFFSIHFVGEDISDKFALISLTCYITHQLREKGKQVTCYDVLLKIGSDMTDFQKQTVLKALGAICESFMYGCKKFPTFDLQSKDMPATIKKILSNYCPF